MWNLGMVFGSICRCSCRGGRGLRPVSALCLQASNHHHRSAVLPLGQDVFVVCCKSKSSIPYGFYNIRGLFSWSRSCKMSANTSTSHKHTLRHDEKHDPVNPISSMRLLLNLKKVVLVGKKTRYEFEKQRYEGYTEEQFKEVLRLRGSSYGRLLSKHHTHLQNMEYITEVLQKRGVDFKVCTRGHSSVSEDVVNWADAVISAGGDGTFLSVATKIRNRNKPLIGINTAPDRSEGHLCLPSKYTRNLDEALDKLSRGHFRWLFRQRIRTTVHGCETNCEPVENAQILRQRMRGNFTGSSSSFLNDDDDDDNCDETLWTNDAAESNTVLQKIEFKKMLPVLALNEIFMGESMASVPSLYEIQADDKSPEKQKSSGVCISTGTGSTAWSHNICRLHSTSVRNLLNIAQQLPGMRFSEDLTDPVDESVVQQVTEQFARSFVFDASEPRMLFAVRDPMQNKVYSCSEPYGWSKNIVIRSRCWDASLCIDGDTSFAFNDGASAKFEIRAEDALRTVVLAEDDEP